tara:strand:+ start:5532 stop:6500 length:969 start_codon:yes stop_codon:yes gene_type:complete
MIKIGIIGLGNVAWNVHLPILLSRKDIKISWICDTKIDKKKIIEKKNIPYFNNLDSAIELNNCDIALITVPYYERKKIFDKIKNNVKGIFFEKPFALNLNEHNYFSNNFNNYALTIGFQRRHMGIVKTIKNIIESNLFGPLSEIDINFGDIHYKFDGFRADKNKAGGGIFFETGSHWIDTVLFTSKAIDIKDFSVKKISEDYLDVDSSGFFKINNENKSEIKCKFHITSLKNTSNKITYKFKNCSIDLFLFDDNSNLIVHNKDSSVFIIKNNEFHDFPNTSLGVGASYWSEFINSFKDKKESEISINNFLLTSKIMQFFYEQ